ncbi:tetratricopeptide repeat protein [Streptomyces sp. NPDC087440]|uniref:tetratricopeptide repeat protein n=1 Tax=Streptomyces sp. NPDC087440 TaxID=3365790 RepID=UPI00382E813C
MLDLISVGAISTVLGAVASGTASEAGKWVWQSAGSLVQRILGREVAAPVDQRQVELMAAQLHEAMRDDPGLARDWDVFARTVRRASGARSAPRLPAASRHFMNRQGVLKALDEEAARKVDGRPKVALLHGPEGIGTTEIAWCWGGREAERRFKDGQIYLDLRGGPHGAMSSGAALREALRQLGVPQEEIPPSEPHRAEFFRRCVADLALLVVLDHASSAAQALPLIATAPGVVTVVTARDPLLRLPARRIPVGPLADKYVRRLLEATAGRPALDAARALLPSVIADCGGSPYAVLAAAPRLAHVPQPRTERTQLPAMPERDAVRTAIDHAYQTLDPVTARVHRLTALRPWPAVTPALAARAANLAVPDAARALDVLATSRLLDTTPQGHYRHRPSARAQAEQAAAREDGPAVCSAAVGRVLDGYLHFAEPTARAALPQSWRSPQPRDSDEALTYESQSEALGALAAESANLAEAVAAADEFGRPDTVCRLVRALWPVQLKAGHLDVVLPALHTGARTADEHFPGTRTAAMMHAHLGFALTALERYEEAGHALEAAARDESAAGHVRGQASAIEGLGLLRLAQWRWEEAYALFDRVEGLYAAIGPGDEGAADLPRALALLERHRGRALTGLGRTEEARERLGAAVRYFRAGDDAYNMARCLTDLARTHVDGTRRASPAEQAAALPLVDEAIAVLEREGAEHHLAYLRRLRALCVSRGAGPAAG